MNPFEIVRDNEGFAEHHQNFDSMVYMLLTLAAESYAGPDTFPGKPYDEVCHRLAAYSHVHVIKQLRQRLAAKIVHRDKFDADEAN